MSATGQAGGGTIRRHATRPHRVRGQHRASWAAELAPLVDGTQRRYTAVVGSAVAGASIVAMAGATGLPTEAPDPAASEAAADVVPVAEEAAAPSPPATAPLPDRQATTPHHGEEAPPAEPSESVDTRARTEERDSPIAAQPPQVEWAPMLDQITITSLFGQRWGRSHNGVDFAAAPGTPVYAVRSGTVAYAGWESGFGNLVVIDHGEGVETYYAHNSELLVAEGRPVEAGEHIADAGNSGFSLGPHLHFEVRVDGEPVEPIGYLESAGLPLPQA